jgi:putative acetyltransferase
MKIQKVNADNQKKAFALLRRVFGEGKEVTQVEAIHQNGLVIHDWIAVQGAKAIGYIAFTHAYHDDSVCGFHLGPLAIALDFQKQGVGTELMQFALRQKVLQELPLFVLGQAGFFERFGFQLCQTHRSQLTKKKAQFLMRGDLPVNDFTIGYERIFISNKLPKSKQQRNP